MPTKAELRTEKGDTIACLFNPAEITIAKSNAWGAGQAKGRNAPRLRFQGGQSATLTMTLTLDTTHNGRDVSEYTKKLLDLLRVDTGLSGSEAGRNAGRPPWVEFHWGSLHSFKAVVERLSLRFTYFAADGRPLRAKADISLKQWDDDEKHPLQNPTSHTDSLHSIHSVLPGQTLDRIASRFYGDPARWRLIAEHNDVENPLDLPAGTLLAIPDLPVRDRG